MNIEQALKLMGKVRRNRRGAITLTVGGGLVVAGIAKCRQESGPGQKIVRSSAQIQDYLQYGSSIRTPEDLQTVFRTRSDADLPYATLATAKRIRAIEDPVKRVMAAIGYLDVENSGNKRYDVPDGACNIYALDLLRLVLGNSVIGSRFNLRNGAPEVLGINNADWENQAAIDRFGAENPYLAAFNLDKWLRTHGTRYGWSMSDSAARLREMLQSGEYIALGVSKNEDTRGEPGRGHSYVLTYADTGLGWSQATINIRYKTISETDDKARPGHVFNIHTHRIPNTPQ